MPKWAICAMLAIPLAAQQDTPIGLVHGSLVDVQTAGAAGEFTVRLANDRVLRFRYDNETWFERAHERMFPVSLEKGMWVEIVGDDLPGNRLPYARTVHVIEPRPSIQQGPRPPNRPHPATGLAALPTAPHGDLTFSGVVSRLDGDRLTLHTRTGIEQTVLLRPDTAYLSSGNPVGPAMLQPNTRVFVRAGKTPQGRIEADQVVWGDILEPR